MSSLSRCLPAVLASLCLLVAPAAAQAKPSKSQRAEAKRLYRAATVNKLDPATEQQMDARMKALEQEIELCTGTLEQRLQSPQVDPDDQINVVFTVIGVAMFDVIQESVAMVRPQVDAGLQRMSKVRLRDRQLRALVAAKRRQVKGFAALPQIDTCALLDQWAQAHFTKAGMPAELKRLAVQTRREKADEKIVARGEKRLRSFGLTRKQASAVANFPLG